MIMEVFSGIENQEKWRFHGIQPMEGVSMAFNQRNGDLACLSIKNMISFDLT